METLHRQAPTRSWFSVTQAFRSSSAPLAIFSDAVGSQFRYTRVRKASGCSFMGSSEFVKLNRDLSRLLVGM